MRLSYVNTLSSSAPNQKLLIQELQKWQKKAPENQKQVPSTNPVDCLGNTAQTQIEVRQAADELRQSISRQRFLTNIYEATLAKQDCYESCLKLADILEPGEKIHLQGKGHMSKIQLYVEAIYLKTIHKDSVSIFASLSSIYSSLASFLGEKETVELYGQLYTKKELYLKAYEINITNGVPKENAHLLCRLANKMVDSETIVLPFKQGEQSKQALYLEALRLCPDHVEACNDLTSMGYTKLDMQGMYLKVYQMNIDDKVEPENANVLCRLASTMGAWDKIELPGKQDRQSKQALYLEALRLCPDHKDPDHVEACHGLGSTMGPNDFISVKGVKMTKKALEKM